jgi:hypothetical protein
MKHAQRSPWSIGKSRLRIGAFSDIASVAGGCAPRAKSVFFAAGRDA